ncbi:4-hydroxyphenylacetate degradation bifunctional isomerase/decarboxylase [Planctomycetales bacterium 10988]|nr:4-hydroxyphenylacetate degradation bifunctional isomerase/decarboxylase [Planctomycetales bacterium 10988]
MRLCRFLPAPLTSPAEAQPIPQFGFYQEDAIIPLKATFQTYRSESTEPPGPLPDFVSAKMTDFLPPDGKWFEATKAVFQWLSENPQTSQNLAIPDFQLEIPVDIPPKFLLLAGNYPKHVEERGDTAAERRETFPYVFWKPPTTSLRPSGATIPLPAINPNAWDYELELAVLIGRRAFQVSEEDALGYVAGYTIVNDLSDRNFRPNPDRRERPRDRFFDWLHGKWHEGSAPCGPCVASASSLSDPQALDMQLTINGEIRQDANTSQQVFSVAAVISFLSSFVPLEPGDLISTGTPAGVGAATGRFLQPGDLIEAKIESIGTLVTKIAQDSSEMQ